MIPVKKMSGRYIRKALKVVEVVIYSFEGVGIYFFEGIVKYSFEGVGIYSFEGVGIYSFKGVNTYSCGGQRGGRPRLIGAPKE